MKKPKKLSFRATRVRAEVNADVQSLAFEIERDGDPIVFFGIVNERSGSVRVSWSDGKLGGDECVVAVASAALDEERFRLDYKDPEPDKMGPYKGVEIAFAELEPRVRRDVAEAFARLFGPKRPPAPAMGDRKRTNPQLGVIAASRTEWRARIGNDTPLEMSLSNGGGGALGIVLEIGGPAIAAGHVEVREAKAQGKTAKVEAKAGVVRSVLEHVRVEADLDIDRKAAGKGAPPLPTFPLTVVVRGKKAGQGLLTVRVVPRTADGRGGAMLGRTIVVES